MDLYLIGSDAMEVLIQVQDQSGMWRTMQMTQRNDQMIIRSMDEVKRNYPDYRVRAVDADTGAMLNIL